MVLPRALRAFERTDPQLHVDLHMMQAQEILMQAQEILRTLRSGELDVALTNNIVPKDFEGLSVEELGTYPLRVAAHKKHRFARLREGPMSELARQPILAFTRDEYPAYQVQLSQLFLPYTPALKIAAEYESLESIIAGVESGRGGRLFIRACLVSLPSAGRINKS